MAPAVLIQPESPRLFPRNLDTSAKFPTAKTASIAGGVSLEARQPAGSTFPSHSSSSPAGNANIQNGCSSGIAGRSGSLGSQLNGNAFITSQTLLQKSRDSAAVGLASDGSPKKPNILYIMADQMAAPLLRMNDPDSPIKTPNLDALASTGVVFGSAYCNSPLCAPSRFVMCTGQLPSKIGGYDNASVLRPEEPTYAHYLRREGYETVLAGKMHFIGPDQLHGFEHRLALL